MGSRVPQLSKIAFVFGGAMAVAIWPVCAWASVSEAASTAAAGGAPEDLVDSTSLTTPVILEGRLERGGAGIHGHVRLIAEPRADIMASLKEGAPFKSVPVAKQKVSSSGNFALRMDPRVPVEEIVADTPRGKLATFHVLVTSDNKTTIHVLSRYLVDTPQGQRWKSATTYDPGSSTAAPGVVSAAPAVVEDEDSNLRIDVARGRVNSEQGISKMPKATANFGSCGGDVIRDLGTVWAVVGQTYNGPSTSEFRYSGGASSSLGVGIKQNGDNSWSVAGEKSVSSNSTQYYPTMGQDTGDYFETKFHYAELYHVCGAPFPAVWRTIQPIGWAGGSRTSGAGWPDMPFCVPEMAGSGFDRTDTKAVKWSNGVNLGAFGFGINFSAQTGYSASSYIKYHFNSDGFLCGMSNYPGSSSGGAIIGTFWPDETK